MGDSPTKKKIDAFLAKLPFDDEHCEPTRAMLGVTAVACNGAPDKIQAVCDAVGEIGYFLALVHRSEPERISAAVVNGLRAHIEECPALIAASAIPPPSAPESPQNVKTMLATALANNMKWAILAAAVSVTAVFIALGSLVVYTRQIPEAANAAQILTDK